MPAMAGKRSYDDACAAAHAMDIVGERWALLVVRELMLGPKRFTDLRQGLPGISPNVLAQRLEQLEAAGVVRRRQLPPPAPSRVYQLTDWGQELEPAIRALGRWGARSPARPARAPMSPDSFVLSLRTMFDAEAAASLTASIALRIGADAFHATVGGGRIDVVRGEAQAPDASLEGEAAALAGLVYGGRTLAEAVRSGDVRSSGDKAVLRRFLALFPLPEPA
jgi:DNA-binding HxlR family transcriptional regulator